MTRCAGCGKELDESQIYYREDDLKEEEPYCESCAVNSARDIQPRERRFSKTGPKTANLESKDQIERLQAKMFVLGLLNIVSGIAQLFLALLIPLLLIALLVSALISIGIGSFLIFY